MVRLMNATVSCVLVLGLAVTGCGSSESGSSSSTQATSASQTSSSPRTAGTETQSTNGQSTAPAPQTRPPAEHVPNVTIKLSSSVFEEGGAIPAHYTCDGADVSPPLHWSAIPKGMVELDLFVSQFGATAPDGGPLISWDVAGLKPTLKGLETGKVPAGAVVGRNSFGQTRYSLCPPKGRAQHYIVSLYALPHTIPVKSGFAAEPLFKVVGNTAEYKGQVGFSYTRR